MSIETGGWVPIGGRILAGVDGRTIQKGDRLHVRGRYAGDFGFELTVGDVTENEDGSFTISAQDPNLPDGLAEMYRVPEVVPPGEEDRA